ncbi:MAG: hypothetical protein KDA84_16350, partial [Planctomycetaceae bacterium]|nr:hypothetical protein [Planctomycetaceae bacterium]
GETFARFRISTQGGLSSGGLASDGEVEDYRATVFDPDALPDRNADGEQLIGMISQQARLDVNDVFSNRVEGRVSEDITRLMGSGMGTEIPRGTSAQIGASVIVNAGRDVNVKAIQSTDVNLIVGAAGISLASGVSGSVGIALIDTPVQARIGESSQLMVEGSIDVNAEYRADSDGFGFTGQLGIVGVNLGAQVLVFEDSSDQTAEVSNGVSITQSNQSFSRFDVQAEANRDFDLHSIGAETGQFAGGAAIAIANVTGDTSASLGEGVAIDAPVGTSVPRTFVTASTNDVISTEVIGIAAGFNAAGQGAYAGSTLDINVDATLEHNVQATTASVELTSRSESDVDAKAFGGAAGGVAVGVMLANAKVDGRRRTHVGDGSQLDSNLTMETLTDNSVQAQTIAAVAGIGAGQGNVATAELFPADDSTPNVEAAIGDDVLVTGSVDIDSDSRGDAKAESFGIAVGVLAIGVNEANAVISPNVVARVGERTVIQEGLHINATHNRDAFGDLIDRKAEAIAGPSGPAGFNLGNLTLGILAGTGATANAESSAFVTVDVGNDVEIRRFYNIRSVSFNDADATSRGTTAGVVGVGVIQANAISGGDTIAHVGENVILSAPNSSPTILSLADHEADAFAEASSVGIATGQGALADATVGVDSDDPRRNSGSGITEALTETFVGDNASLTTQNTLTLSSEARTDADATARGVNVGLFNVGISEADAAVYSDVQTRTGIGSKLQSNGFRILGFPQGGEIELLATADNNATANGNASGGGLIDIKGFDGEASVEDSETRVIVGPETLISATFETTLGSDSQNTVDVDGNVSTFGVVGIGTTEVDAKVEDLQTLVTVQDGAQLISQQGNLIIEANETTRITADADAAAGGLVSGAGADAHARTNNLEVETLLAGDVVVDIAGNLNLTATYDPEIDADAEGTNDSVLFSAAKVGYSRAFAKDDSDVKARIGDFGTATINVGGDLMVKAERTGIFADHPTIIANASGSDGDDLISLFNKNNSQAEAEIDSNVTADVRENSRVNVGGDFHLDAIAINQARSSATNESDQFASVVGDDDSNAETLIFSNVIGRIAEAAVIDVGQTFDMDVKNRVFGISRAEGAGDDVSASSDGEAIATTFVDFGTQAFVGDNAVIRAIDEISILAESNIEAFADAEFDAEDLSLNVEPDTFAYAVISERQETPDENGLFDLDEVSDGELVNRSELPTEVRIGAGAKLESQVVDLYAHLVEAQAEAVAETDSGQGLLNNVDADGEALASVYTLVNLAPDSNVIGTQRVRLASLIDDVNVKVDANAHLHGIVDQNTDADGTAIITSRAEVTAEPNSRVESSDLLVHSELFDQDLTIFTQNNVKDFAGSQETDRPRVVTKVKIDYDANTLITRDPLTLEVDESGNVTAEGVAFSETTDEVIVTGLIGGATQPGEIEFRLGVIEVDQADEEDNDFPFDDDIGIFDEFTGDPTLEFGNANSEVFIENRSDKNLRIQDLSFDDAGGGFPVVQFTGQLFQLGFPGFITYEPEGVNQMIGNLAAPGDPSDLGAVITNPLLLQVQPQFLEETDRVKFVDAGGGVTINNLGDSQVLLDGQIDTGREGRVRVRNMGGDILATQTDQFIRATDISLTATGGDVGSDQQPISTHLLGGLFGTDVLSPTIRATADGDVFLSVAAFGNENNALDPTVLIDAQTIRAGGDVSILLNGVGEFDGAWPTGPGNLKSVFRIDQIQAGNDVDIQAQRADFVLDNQITAGNQVRLSSETGSFFGRNQNLDSFVMADSAILEFSGSIDVISLLGTIEATGSDVRWVNFGPLTVGGLSDVNGITATDGSINLTNLTEVAITENLIANVGDIEIRIPDFFIFSAVTNANLIVSDNAQIQSDGFFSAEVGDLVRLDQGTGIAAGGDVTFLVDDDSTDPEGATVEIFGLISGASLAIVTNDEDVADSVTLARVAANTPTTINTKGGNDVITIGDEINRTGLDEIQSQVNVTPQGGDDQLLITDVGSNDARAYAIREDRVVIAASENGITGIGDIIFNNTEEVLLKTAAGLDRVNIEALRSTVDLEVNTGKGNDEITIANP